MKVSQNVLLVCIGDTAQNEEVTRLAQVSDPWIFSVGGSKSMIGSVAAGRIIRPRANWTESVKACSPVCHLPSIAVVFRSARITRCVGMLAIANASSVIHQPSVHQ